MERANPYVNGEITANYLSIDTAVNSVTFGGGIIGIDATTGDWLFNRGNQ